VLAGSERRLAFSPEAFEVEKVVNKDWFAKRAKTRETRHSKSLRLIHDPDECPFLAQSGHRNGVSRCLLLGE
jgi:hypothetical protein